jgi:hypothetical protein
MEHIDRIKGNSRGICALCHNEGELCASHIVPEFVFAEMYDEKHRFIAASPAGPTILQRPQKAWREYLLCAGCERHLNENFEAPFKRYWLDGGALSRLATQPLIVLDDVDYASFKLFHLSVLWRASVCTLNDFRTVRLGPHEDAIRRMILEKDPGPSWKYPVICFGIVHENQVQHNLSSDPLAVKLYGQRGFTFRFCGCQWIYLVASHPAWELEGKHLTEDGRMPVLAVPLREIVARDIAASRSRR